MGDDSVVLARFSRKVEPEPQHTADTVKTSNADTKSETSCESNGYPVWKQTETSKDEEEIEACGWGHLTISQCQKFRDPRWFLVVITLCGACQGMAINGFVNTAISTLEKRFEISSTETGLIASCYDIMFVLLVIPISYFGGQGNKPRYLGIGIFILGLGSFVFSLPHFLSGQYVVENAQETTCIRPNSAGNVSQTVVDPCESNLPSTLSNYKYFFFLGQLLHGAGATSLYTLGVVYLDENVSPRSSSLYNGIFYTGAVIGPAIGFILGSEFLSIFTEIGVDADSMGLDINNPKWVGAWWIGFLLSGTFAVLLSFPLLAFPRSLPGHTKYAAERGKEVQAQTGQDETGKKPGLRDIWLSIRLLFTNWPFMFINIAAATEGILVAGFSTFMPKFIEYQFGYPASTAALYVGLIVVPTGGGATVVSGYIVRRFNLKVRGILKLCTGMSAVLCLFVLAFLMECENSPFAGITLPYGQTAAQTTAFIGKRLESGCNVDCACAEQDYFPMCGRDNVMYFSPCYAGCTEVFQDGNTKLYGNCSCVSYTLTEEDITSSRTHMGEFGKCHYSCSWFKYFMVLFGIMIVLIFGLSMPSLTATLRCIPDHQRSFGLGIQWIVARCLGSIPGPIMFGKMIDLACLAWQKRCDGTGSCFFYDNHKMSVNLLILAVVFCVASTIAFGLALLLYKVKDTGEEVVEINMEDPKEVDIKPYTIQAESQDIESTGGGLSNGVSQSAPYYDNHAMDNS